MSDMVNLGESGHVYPLTIRGFCMDDVIRPIQLDTGDEVNQHELNQIKQQANDLLKDLDVTISSSPSIGSTLKNGIRSTIKELASLIQSFTCDDTTTTESSGVTAKAPIELDCMTLKPLTKEVVCEGKTVRLPRAEFVVLYKLASHAGQEVDLGTAHSLLTRMSTIRRAIPSTKQRIESLGKGKYILNAVRK